jgi:hypothetical protein
MSGNNGILSDRIKEIENEISTDKKKYLNNCFYKYKEYIEVALPLFKDVYEKMNKIDKRGDTFSEYNLKATKLKEEKNYVGEIDILKEIIAKGEYAPFYYERMAILYSKIKDYQAAYQICKCFFETDYWKIPNMSNKTLKLLLRMENLEEKIK